ncbi:MAG: SdrD B-like domain-containing protein [Eubacteriales bacterium]|nr:SdrD B-like domain-containing protein [Eubacteriales bacterium]
MSLTAQNRRKAFGMMIFVLMLCILPISALGETTESAATATGSIMGAPSTLEKGAQVALASADLQQSAAVAEDGSFAFLGLPAGEYSVYAPLPENTELSEDSQWQITQQGDMVWMTVSVKDGEITQLPDFGFLTFNGITGCAYADENGSLRWEEGEPLMSGVQVILQQQQDDQWQEIASAQTDEYGRYSFLRIGAGHFRICARSDTADFYAAAVGNTTVGEGAGYEGTLTCGSMIELSETAGSDGLADISLQKPAALLFTAFVDSNANGARDGGEQGVAGVQVNVMDEQESLSSGTTDSNGELTLTGIRPGSYTMQVNAPTGYGFTVKGTDSSVAASENASLACESITLVGGESLKAGAGMVKAASFSGKVFEDINNDGVMDETEPGVAGVLLRLEGQKSGRVFELITDETGLYTFNGLPNDRYLFSAVLPEGMLYARYSKTGGDLRSVFSGSVVTREFSIKNEETVTDKNVGVVQNGVLVGTAFFDLNDNGYYDEGEPGYAGVTVEAIKISSGDSMGKTQTDENGAFRLENLRSGDYRLRAILPSDGSIFATVPATGGDLANLFEQRGSRRENTIQPITILSGAEANALIGVARGATIQGSVFQDTNYNGRLDSGEKLFSGIEVVLTDENGNELLKGRTNSAGTYTLEGIMPGTYIVKVRRIQGNGFTRLRPEEAGGNHVVELIDDYGVTAAISIAMGQTLQNINAGMLPASTVTGRLFHDLNDDGLWSDGEAGMDGASVRLLSEDGEIDLTRSVEQDGTYFFDGVMPGNYTLTYQLPEHTEMARVTPGGNTVANEGRETVTASFGVAMGEGYECPLAGAVTLGSFQGVVFKDANANGVQDAEEKALSGAVLTLTPSGSNAEEKTAKTESDGAFSLMELRPSSYQLTVTLPDGYIFSAGLDEEALNFGTVNSQTLPCPWSTLTNRMAKQIGAVKPASIAGVVWLDENKDGKQQKDEALMAGISLRLTDESTGMTAASVQTNADGFLFENVRPGAYTVSFDLPSQSKPAEDQASTFTYDGSMRQTGIRVEEGQQLTGLSTGLVSETSVGGTLTLVEAGQRTPVEGVTVTLWAAGGTEAMQSTVTGADGAYRFDGLWPNDYLVKAQLPNGMIFVRPNDENFDKDESIIVSEQNGVGQSDPFTVKMAKHMLSQNILYIKPAKLGDQIWLDENGNGLIDGGEPMIPGVKLMLVQNGETVYETESDAFGYYLFDAVYPGSYTLMAEAYPELTPTTPVEGLRIISSCLTSGDGGKASSDEFSLESASSNMDYNLGYVLLDGQEKPAVISEPELRNWTVSNDKYQQIQELMK